MRLSEASDNRIIEIDDGTVLNAALADAIGIRVVVTKRLLAVGYVDQLLSIQPSTTCAAHGTATNAISEEDAETLRARETFPSGGS
jgi:hypothetical protein